MRRYDGYFVHKKRLEFYNEITPWLVQGLKDIGHDIWDNDVGGDQQTWSADYERLAKASKLVVKFGFPGTVRVGWEDRSF